MMPIRIEDPDSHLGSMTKEFMEEASGCTKPEYLYAAAELNDDELSNLIKMKTSFAIADLDGKMSLLVERLERFMTAHKMETRVYTIGRSAVVAAAAIPTGITQVTGIFAGLGILAHNFATYNPDYLIGKDLINQKILVMKMRVEHNEQGQRKSRWDLLCELGNKTKQIMDNVSTQMEKKIETMEATAENFSSKSNAELVEIVKNSSENYKRQAAYQELCNRGVIKRK